MESKYKEKHTSKSYDFEKVANSEDSNSANSDDPAGLGRRKFDYRNVNFRSQENASETDPIKMNTTDSNYVFDNEDAIINPHNKKKNN